MKRTTIRTMLAAVAGAAFTAFAGTELIQNGDFEAGNATDQTWGSYANKSGYSNPGWTVSDHGGLAKPNGDREDARDGERRTAAPFPVRD